MPGNAKRVTNNNIMGQNFTFSDSGRCGVSSTIRGPCALGNKLPSAVRPLERVASDEVRTRGILALPK